MSARRPKPSTATTRDLASTTSTHLETQTTVPAPPREMTLSERLASIGRITSTMESSEDPTASANQSVTAKK